MKRFHILLTLVIAFSMTAFAQIAAPKGTVLPFNGMVKQTKAATLKANRATVPETAVIETDWALTGNYINGGNPYSNSNTIAVAFDGNDIYVQGLVFLCPDAWIQGTIDGSTVTFANGQYAGLYNGTTIYACGSSDGSTVSDIIFAYDAAAGTLTLQNYYIENTVTDAFNFYFYSYDIVLAKTVPAAALPTDVVVEPGITNATVAWTENGTATSWNLRYRYMPKVLNYLWDFEDANQLDGWMALDEDGDSHCWTWANAKVVSHSGSGVVTSASYDEEALFPDNWLISPQVPMGGTASFWYCGQDPDYADEVFAVYVANVETLTGYDDFVKIGDDITATGEYQQFTIDLSGYEGVGYIAIRHYNVTDKFWLNIDDFSVEVPGGEYPGEWQVIEGVTENPYTIEGLTAESNYEVQVQAIGEVSSAWTASAPFTTLAEEVPEIPNVYILGQVNEQGWAPNVGTPMDYNAEDNIYTATVNVEADHTFGFTTEIAENDDAWDYIEPFRFGPESNGDFWLQDEYLGQPLTLTFDVYGAVRVLTSGEYNVTVDLENMKLTINKVEPTVVLGDVNMDGDINIKDVTDLINYLLTEDATGINLEAANCNGDTTISIADVTVLINYLLTEQW